MLVSLIDRRLLQLQTSIQLQPKQLRVLCERQEQQVMHHLKTIKFDIYAEIGKVCPSQRNLKTIPNEELIVRINSMGQLGQLSQGNPSPKSNHQEDSDMLTEEQDAHLACFPFDQPSIKNFLDLEENYQTWEGMDMELLQ